MEYNYFIVVRTEAIKQEDNTPADAIIHATYWHPGDKDWFNDYGPTLDAIITNISKYRDGQLLQCTDLGGVYEYELVIGCRKEAFTEDTNL